MYISGGPYLKALTYSCRRRLRKDVSCEIFSGYASDAHKRVWQTSVRVQDLRIHEQSSRPSQQQNASAHINLVTRSS